MVTRGDVENRTRKLMVENWGIERERLFDDARLGADLGVDSLDLVELVMAAEDEFDVDIPDGEINGRLCDQTVGDVFATVCKYALPEAA